MFFWQPGKWIQYAGLVVLPFAGASFLTTGGLQSDVSKNAMAAAGGDWAKVQLDGRDITVTGTAPTDAAKTAAIGALGTAYGVRLVSTDGIKVAAAPKAPEPVKVVEAPKPEPLMAPTITSTKADDKGTMVTGTWAEGKAKTLDIMVDDKDYALGTAKELTSVGGVWTLAIPALAVGAHTILANESDGTQKVGVVAPAKVTIDAPPPPPPPPPIAPPAAATVQNVAAIIDHPTVTGTWPVGNGAKYQVELDGVTHTLGKDYDLLSQTDGKWKLTPVKPLVNGTYDVVMKVTGADGQVTSSVGKGAVVVNVPPPPPPPPKAEAYDCVAALNTTAAAFPVRFAFNHADLDADYVKSLANYASVLKDPRCAATKMTVTGNADYIGSEAYNMALSESRANTVVTELGKDGVDASRLSAMGAGKTKPLDPAHSEDARAKNRRAEFTIQ